MNILVIKDEKPGHYNQTEGLLLALKDIYPDAKVEYCHVEIKNKISRKLLRFLLNNSPIFFKNKAHLVYLRFFYTKFKLPDVEPDIVVSTGGNTSNINAWFGYAYRCQNILNGALRGLKEMHFTGITTVLDLGYKNQIILDVAPSVITQKTLNTEANKFIKTHNLNSTQKYYALLVGGDGAGYTYDENFYKNLIRFISSLANKQNIKWLITTSRRTPVKVEKLIKNEISTNSCEYFVSYNQNPEKILSAFFGLSECVFTTEESASMISEAISSGKNIYTIQPENFKHNKNYQALLTKFSQDSLIKRLKVTQIPIINTQSKLSSNYHAILVEKLKRVL